MRQKRTTWVRCFILGWGVLGLAWPLAGAQPFYRGLIRLEVALKTGDGVHLEKGQYAVEVRPNRGHYALVFLSNGKVGAVANGHPAPQDSKLPATVPLMGTEYLRSSGEPELTVEERHFSKTGQPQYQEEARDWKATLRAFKSEEDSQVFFVFQERQADGKWRRVDFQLHLQPGS